MTMPAESNFHNRPENFSTMTPATAALVRGAMVVSSARQLHVRVHGLPGRDEPFDYYATTPEQRDDFIRRYTAQGYRTEIVGR